MGLISRFTGGIVGIVVTVILIVAVMIPIISANEVQSTVANYESLNTIIGILPVLALVGAVIACVGIFIVNKR